jgi:hypothetical protein
MQRAFDELVKGQSDTAIKARVNRAAEELLKKAESDENGYPCHT